MDYPYVILVNGKPEALLSPRDFEYLLKKHMGMDSVVYFRLMTEGLEAENRELEKELEQVRDELGAVLAEQEGRRWE